MDGQLWGGWILDHLQSKACRNDVWNNFATWFECDMVFWRCKNNGVLGFDIRDHKSLKKTQNKSCSFKWFALTSQTNFKCHVVPIAHGVSIRTFSYLPLVSWKKLTTSVPARAILIRPLPVTVHPSLVRDVALALLLRRDAPVAVVIVIRASITRWRPSVRSAPAAPTAPWRIVVRVSQSLSRAAPIAPWIIIVDLVNPANWPRCRQCRRPLSLVGLWWWRWRRLRFGCPRGHTNPYHVARQRNVEHERTTNLTKSHGLRWQQLIP